MVNEKIRAARARIRFAALRTTEGVTKRATHRAQVVVLLPVFQKTYREIVQGQLTADLAYDSASQDWANYQRHIRDKYGPEVLADLNKALRD